MIVPRDICCGRRPRRISVGGAESSSLVLTYCGVCDTTEWFRDGQLVESPDIRAAAREVAREVKLARKPAVRG